MLAIKREIEAKFPILKKDVHQVISELRKDFAVLMFAEIITIGDEILIGQIVDTNSAFISGELNKIGISVYQITSVQDDRVHILNALSEARSRARIVIITGGLGPTKDDITKHTLCEYLEDTLVLNTGCAGTYRSTCLRTIFQHLFRM